MCLETSGFNSEEENYVQRLSMVEGLDYALVGMPQYGFAKRLDEGSHEFSSSVYLSI